MIKLQKRSIFQCSVDLIPLETSKEGHLLGGFMGISNSADSQTSNNCENGNCSPECNTSVNNCYNGDCGCGSNSSSSSSSSTTSSSGTTIIIQVP